MDPKQQQLQDLVIAYFGQRGDARVEPAGKGLYRVELLSETAQTDFGGQRRISLVFDADRAYENPDGELIIPSLSWPKNAIRAGISRSLRWVIPLALQMLPASPVLRTNLVAWSQTC